MKTTSGQFMSPPGCVWDAAEYPDQIGTIRLVLEELCEIPADAAKISPFVEINVAVRERYIGPAGAVAFAR